MVIAHYNGDDGAARSMLELLAQQARKHSVLLFDTWARHYAWALDGVVHQDATPGLGLIRDIVVTLHTREVDEACFERARQGAAGWCTAEILRARAETLLRQAAPSTTQAAESLLLEALGLAHQQGALAWELRSALSLARLWQREGRYAAARDLLQSVHGRFTEGFSTPDLVSVRGLLDELHHKLPA